MGTLALNTPAGMFVLRFDSALADLETRMRTLWAPMLAESARGPAELVLDVSAEGTNPPGETEPPEWTGCPEQDRVHLSDDPGDDYRLSGTLTRHLLRRLVGHSLLLHAGALERPDLGTVLLVGASGAGKSTATTELAAQGSYLSDEVAILDPITFEVTGYPKPISRIDPDGTKRDHAASVDGLRPALHGAPPAAVVLLDRQTDGTMPSVSRVEHGEAIAAIVGQTSSLWRTPGGLVCLARLLDSVGGALRCTYTEADQLAGLLRDAPAPLTEEWTPWPLRTPAERTEEHSGAPVLRLSVEGSAVLVDDAALILREGGVVRAEGIGLLVVSALADQDAITLDALVEAVVAVAGEHPQARELLIQVVRSLAAEGIVAADEGWEAP